MDSIDRGREIIKSKIEHLAGVYEIEDKEVVERIIDLIESKAEHGEKIIGTEEWRVLKDSVFEGEYTGSTLNTKEVIEDILSWNGEYIKKYKCLVYFHEDKGRSRVSDIGVLYESPGNSATEALRKSESHAEENRDEVGRRFGVGWIDEAIVSSHDTYPPRPFKHDLNGVENQIRILDMGVELEP